MDEQLRAAKRAAETGDPGDIANYYRAMLRSGALATTHLLYLSRLDDPFASLALGRRHLRCDPVETFYMVRDQLIIEMSPLTDLQVFGEVASAMIAELRNRLTSMAGDIRESMRYESFLTRSGWLPYADQLEQAAEELADTPEAQLPGAFRRCYELTQSSHIKEEAKQQNNQQYLAGVVQRLKRLWNI